MAWWVGLRASSQDFLAVPTLSFHLKSLDVTFILQLSHVVISTCIGEGPSGWHC